MTLVKLNGRPSGFPFNNIMDNLFEGFPAGFRPGSTGTGTPSVPVNIQETETAFQLAVVAPGFGKDDFKIDLDKNLLTISVEKKSEKEEIGGKYIRNEYKFNSFQRSFTVDETINTENISAQYVNGVLTLNLPKQVEVKNPAKQITIA